MRNEYEWSLDVEIKKNDYDEYLAHYGVLGQKWGIRRYQNTDGTLTTEGKKRYQIEGIHPEDEDKNDFNRPAGASATWKSGEDFKVKQGSPVYRVTSKENEDESKPKYVSFLKSDMNDYSNEPDHIGISTFKDDVWNTKYDSIKDINIAGSKAALDALIKTVGPKKITDMSLLTGRDLYSASRGERQSKKAVKQALRKSDQVDISKWTPEQVNDYLYYMPDKSRRFDTDIMSKGSEEDKKNYTKYLENQGYDAVVDMVDTSISFAATPTIILDPEKTLKKSASKQVWSVKTGWL